MSDLQDALDQWDSGKANTAFQPNVMPAEILNTARRVANPDYRLEICVTHWRIYWAQRAEPFAEFGFHLCPVEEGTEHEVVNFVALDITEDK